MESYKFYEIRSYKALMIVNGLRKRTLACVGQNQVYCFFWVNHEEAIKQIQFLFGNQIIEWSAKKGLIAGMVHQILQQDRRLEQASISHPDRRLSLDPKQIPLEETLKQGLQLIENSNFPGKMGDLLQQCFTKSKVVTDLSYFRGSGSNTMEEHFHTSVQMMPCVVFKIVAEADGVIDEEELEMFDLYGSEEHSPIQSNLGKLIFLEFRKKPEFFRKAMDRIQNKNLDDCLHILTEGCDFMDRYLNVESSVEFKQDLLEMAVDIAKAAGGIFGMYKVSKDEQKQINRIKAVLGLDKKQLQKQEKG